MHGEIRKPRLTPEIHSRFYSQALAAFDRTSRSFHTKPSKTGKDIVLAFYAEGLRNLVCSSVFEDPVPVRDAAPAAVM